MNFLTRSRLTGYSRVLVGFYLVFWAGWFVTGAGLLGVHDSPAGSDFLSIYAGSHLVTTGEPAAAYDYARFLAAAKEIIGADVRLGPWLYPPIFAIMVLPFTLLPYFVAAPVWLALTAAAYLYAVGAACDRGEKSRKDAAALILFTAEKATQMALQAIQALGGNGYINDYATGRLLRDAKLYEIGAGTSEVRRMLIGRELFKETA